MDVKKETDDLRENKIYEQINEIIESGDEYDPWKLLAMLPEPEVDNITIFNRFIKLPKFPEGGIRFEDCTKNEFGEDILYVKDNIFCTSNPNAEKTKKLNNN